MSVWRAVAVKLGVGLVVAAAFLLLLEGVLRLLPLARWERQPHTSYPLFVPGEGELAGFFVTNPHYARAMSDQRFARVKPPGVKRVFIVGGSAALGWPGPSQSSFTGYLQRAVEQVAPGGYEIINAAAMSYGSHRVLDLLTDIVALEPDLVVVWSGNNEYIERNTLSRFARTAAMGKVQRLLRHSSLYRAVRLLLATVAPGLFVAPEGGEITDLRQLPQVRRGMLGRSAENDRQVLDGYRTNLTAMAGLLRENGVTGIFCTVPVNLLDWVPSNLSEWAPEKLPVAIGDPQLAARWLALSDQASALGGEGRYAEAVALLEQLVQITPDYALGHYLLGLANLQLGQRVPAAAAFQRACDLDPRPVRALSTMREAIRAVAAAEGMVLVDLEGAFAGASRAGVAGLDLFLDYVHPNEAGHKLAAATVARGMATALDPQLPVPRLQELIFRDDWLARQNFSQAAIHYTLGMTRFNNGDLAGAEQAYLLALQEDPEFSEPAGNLGVIHETRGDLNKARDFYQLAVRLDPGTLHAANLARVLYLLGESRGARELGERLLRQGAVDVRLFALLGDIAYAEQRYAAAQEFFQRALEGGGDLPELSAKIEASRQRAGKGGSP